MRRSVLLQVYPYSSSDSLSLWPSASRLSGSPSWGGRNQNIVISINDNNSQHLNRRHQSFAILWVHLYLNELHIACEIKNSLHFLSFLGGGGGCEYIFTFCRVHQNGDSHSKAHHWWILGRAKGSTCPTRKLVLTLLYLLFVFCI